MSPFGSLSSLRVSPNILPAYLTSGEEGLSSSSQFQGIPKALQLLTELESRMGCFTFLEIILNLKKFPYKMKGFNTEEIPAKCRKNFNGMRIIILENMMQLVNGRGLVSMIEWGNENKK